MQRQGGVHTTVDVVPIHSVQSDGLPFRHQQRARCGQRHALRHNSVAPLPLVAGTEVMSPCMEAPVTAPYMAMQTVGNGAVTGMPSAAPVSHRKVHKGRELLAQQLPETP
jgi:hypothetical protein